MKIQQSLLPSALSSCLAAAAAIVSLSSQAAEPPRPLKALLVIGGGWHDYAAQKDILKAGLEARAHLQVDVSFTPAGQRAGNVKMEAYAKPDWAAGYDVIIHDECSTDVRDPDYLNSIYEVHKTIPAVNLHCAMHCYRWGNIQQPVKAGDDNARWFEFIGLQSTGHGPQLPIAIAYAQIDHPIIKGLTNWTTINEELYNNIQVFPTATPLAHGKQVQVRNGSTNVTETVVTWVNDYRGTRVFSTSLGHNNATVEDGRYLDLVTRGLLWACDKLNDTYLKPVPKNN